MSKINDLLKSGTPLYSTGSLRFSAECPTAKTGRERFTRCIIECACLPADRRPADLAPGSMHFRIGFRTSLSDVPGDPLPLILTVELQGQQMGEVGRFVDTADGHFAAQVATRIGLRVVDLIAHHDMSRDATA